jgi:hypothetical protein
MTISKIITSASLAFAILGGAIALAPTSAHSAGKGKFIDYRTLERNRIPCSKRGQSFNNCKVGGEANPYKRGCSDASRCARH